MGLIHSDYETEQVFIVTRCINLDFDRSIWQPEFTAEKKEYIVRYFKERGYIRNKKKKTWTCPATENEYKISGLPKLSTRQFESYGKRDRKDP